jgi:hypothetical protein
VEHVGYQNVDGKEGAWAQHPNYVCEGGLPPTQGAHRDSMLTDMVKLCEEQIVQFG